VTIEAKLARAKQVLGHHWVLSPHYDIKDNPQHSCLWTVDVRQTFARVKARQLREVFAEFKAGKPNKHRDRSATTKTIDLPVPRVVHKRPAPMEELQIDRSLRELWDQSARAV
jgi:hypothetical protein